MKRWFLLLHLMFLASSTQAGQDYPGTDQVVARLLLSTTQFDVRLASKIIHNRESIHPEILDLAAEVMWSACSGRRVLDSDTLSWLAKAIGNRKQLRHAGVVDHCLATTSDKKVIKYLTVARQNLTGSVEEPYQAGEKDLARMRAQQLAAIPPPGARSRLAIEYFEKINRGQLLDEVYGVLGAPGKVSGGNIPAGTYGRMHVKVRVSQDLLVLAYPGLGTLRFLHDEQSRWDLHDATSEKGLIWSSGEGRFVATVDDLIVGGNAAELRIAARKLLRSEQVGRPTLDRIAERIHRSQDHNDDKMGDALAWLCKVIAKSGDGRYKAFLNGIAESAADSKLRKYARQSALQLPEVSDDPFKPAGATATNL